MVLGQRGHEGTGSSVTQRESCWDFVSEGMAEKGRTSRFQLE